MLSMRFAIRPKATGFGSQTNGGELLFLALATCYCNDIYREAAKRGIAVAHIDVEVEGEFGAEGGPATAVTYRAKVAARASAEALQELMTHTDRVAEIRNTLRAATPVTLSDIEATSLYQRAARRRASAWPASRGPITLTRSSRPRSRAARRPSAPAGAVGRLIVASEAGLFEGSGPMPLQNRVDPYGALVATPERGTLMGNRGRLHDAERRIARPRGWRPGQICGGRRQPGSPAGWSSAAGGATVMRPGHYTELFFLDEATALAAGHRPCGECRRGDFLAFRDAWAAADAGRGEAARVTAGDIDRRLHGERLTDEREKRTYTERLDRLPDGAIVLLEPGGPPRLVVGDALCPGASAATARRPRRPAGAVVRVLTPPSTVAAMARGYRPALHPSARVDETA